MNASQLCVMPATELRQLIDTRAVSCREVMAEHLQQIAAWNPTITAIVSMIEPDEALALADAADDRLRRDGPRGPLHGFPHAVKDLADAAGFPTTRGSPIYVGTIPAQDCAIVERIRAAGAIIIGKTNVPEFGLGSHTYNTVFGPTRNPYQPSRSAGGSSGGAGAALATGMVPVADGSDMGGSLRNPGNFNNVVGFRPSPGLVPSWPTSHPWLGLSVKGPMARTVADAALLLNVIAGPDPRDQLAHPTPVTDWVAALSNDVAGARIAWCPDLGGLPLDPEVRAVLDAARDVFVTLGCEVVDAAPDLRDAEEIFQTLRAAFLAAEHEQTLAHHRALLKPEAIWNIEQGLRLSATAVGRAMARQEALFQRFREFMSAFDGLVCAVNQVPPFPIEWAYPTEIEGVSMPTYISWMQTAYFITVTRSPAISVPAGFTPQGLPVGLQIVGRFRDDLGVLRLAHAFESATEVWRRRPQPLAQASG